MIDLSYITIILALFLIVLIIADSCEYFSPENINPGFGSQMTYLETANPIDYNNLANNWNEGSFGKLVSYMENTSSFPAIKNLNV